MSELKNFLIKLKKADPGLVPKKVPIHLETGKVTTGIRWVNPTPQEKKRGLGRKANLMEVITKTRNTAEKYKISGPQREKLRKEKLFWVKSYNNKQEGVIRGEKNYYVKDLFDIYGPFKTLEIADGFLKDVLRTYMNAIREAEVSSWKEEGKDFGSPRHAYD